MCRFLVLAGLLTSSIAVADPPRYTRKPDLRIDVKPSDRVKPVVPRASAPAQPLTADDILRTEADAQPIRGKQEATLVRLVNATPDADPDKPDLLFRLAELYAYEHRFWHLTANAPNSTWCQAKQKFYQDPTTNHYAKAVHANVIDELAYAFQSDDHCDASCFVSLINPSTLTIALNE